MLHTLCNLLLFNNNTKTVHQTFFIMLRHKKVIVIPGMDIIKYLMNITLLQCVVIFIIKILQWDGEHILFFLNVYYRKGLDGSTIPSFSKCLEHFYSLCDELECQLNLAYQQLSQTLISAQHVPSMASINMKSDPKSSQVIFEFT